MAQQSSFYNTDGTTRTFPSSKHIASKQHVAVYLKTVSSNTWSIIEQGLYELVNNSIVFVDAPDNSLYSELEIRVADTAAELTESPSDIAIVAGSIADINTVASSITDVGIVSDNITQIGTVSGSITNVDTVAESIANVNTVATNAANVNTVATDITNVNTVATNITNVNTVATNVVDVNTVSTNITNVNTVATNITDVVSVVDTIVPNIAEILLADTNATTATTQAGIATTKAGEAGTSATNAQLRVWEAEAERLTADSYATEVEDVFVKVYTSNGDGTFTATNTAEYSALHWRNKAALLAVGQASNISVTPTGNIASTDVQSALAELDTEKISASNIHNATSKVTPIDADELPLLDSAGSFSLKKLTWANLKATLFSSSALTGTPTAPTASSGTNTTQIATTAFVQSAISSTGNGNIKAWANINGTGTVAIKASGNISSIGDNGTGNYTLNVITPIIDTNYSLTGTCLGATASNGGRIISINGVEGTGATLKTTTQCQFNTVNTATGVFVDNADISVNIVR